MVACFITDAHFALPPHGYHTAIDKSSYVAMQSYIHVIRCRRGCELTVSVII